MKRTDSARRKLIESILALCFALVVLAVLALVDLNDQRWEYPSPEVEITNKPLTAEQARFLAELHNPMKEIKP
ncbi:MAG TPA: hypothetical protein VN023_09435 [Methylovorus sp.]|nr:hypothetical protein [Methylovorus sp.]